MRLDLYLFEKGLAKSRSFSKSPSFTIVDNLNGLYAELKTIGSWKNATLCDSKVKHGSDMFKTLYFSDDTPSNYMYIKEVVCHTIPSTKQSGAAYSSTTYTRSGTSTGSTFPSKMGSDDADALYMLCLAQGAGGGGGGADNSWGLFNYAAGGGGGGGGGATCAAVYIPTGKVGVGVTIGVGGSGGSSANKGGSPGGGGGSTYIYFTDAGSNTAKMEISADGGYGGATGANNDAGAGGHYGGGYVSDYSSGFSYTTMFICYGGKGGNGASNGGTISFYDGTLANNINGSSITLSNANLYTASVSGNRTGGSAGSKSGHDDSGGGGGASLLGNGGSY